MNTEKENNMIKKYTAGALLIIGVALSACGSQADTVSKNISKEAEKFNVQRRIVGITDKVEFEVEGQRPKGHDDRHEDGSLYWTDDELHTFYQDEST